jgi:mannose-6-phosphate isomerase-like protein (cupin superfamily)
MNFLLSQNITAALSNQIEEHKTKLQMEKFEFPALVPGKITMYEVMQGTIQDVQTEYVSFVGPCRYKEQDHTEKEVVWLFLGGSGLLETKDRIFNVKDETIAFAPEGWLWEINVNKDEYLLALRITKKNSAEDNDDLKSALFVSNNAAPYVKKFEECIPYNEAIKSNKTISRTLLPEYFVPRMAIGTVETKGPDRVARHKHPMLEQLFIGLKDNNSIVILDDAEIYFPPLSILHIPPYSMHGTQVTDGNKLYYVWMDFFTSREGQQWLKNHKSVT